MTSLYNWIEECFYRVSVKAVVKDKNKFMLCLDDSWYWDFPGWGIDHWENIEEALKREVMEEMWIKIQHSSTQPIYSYLWRSTQLWLPICVMCYKVELEHYNFTPSNECRKIWFFDSKDVENLKTYNQNREIITYLEK